MENQNRKIKFSDYENDIAGQVISLLSKPVESGEIDTIAIINRMATVAAGILAAMAQSLDLDAVGKKQFLDDFTQHIEAKYFCALAIMRPMTKNRQPDNPADR